MRLAYGFILSLWLFAIPAVAQKHDYIWLTGDDSHIGYNSNWDHWFGISRFDFTEDTVSLSYDSLGINFDRANATISDKAGNLLFYTNGITIRNSLDEVIENGDSLGYESYYISTFDPYTIGNGHRFNNLALCVPINNGNEGLYRYLYGQIDSFGYKFVKLLIAEINTSYDFGKGKVNYKDVTLVDEVLAGKGFAATRHGNGRDWWVIVRTLAQNCYNVVFLGDQMYCNYHASCAGASFEEIDHGTMDVSNDGNWVVSTSSDGNINIFTFDRCNGVLNFYEQASVPISIDSAIFPYSIEFSPDSRYMYLFCSNRVYQYDMQSTPINSSIKIIAEWDGFADPFPISLYHGQLAPDGKIYVSSGSSAKWIGVINKPNLADTLCEFKPHYILLPSVINGLTYYPNYRLGAKVGSPCDTLTSLNEIPADKLLQVYPNPATDYLFADYGYLPWNKFQDGVTIEITDATGRVIYQQELPKYSGVQKLDVQLYSPGLYYLSLVHNNKAIVTHKWVKG